MRRKKKAVYKVWADLTGEQKEEAVDTYQDILSQAAIENGMYEIHHLLYSKRVVWRKRQ